jgi:hypothetical protein
LFYRRIIPFLLLAVFLVSFAGKTFHHHHDHFEIFSTREAGQVIEENCSICNYESFAFIENTPYDCGQPVILAGKYLIAPIALAPACPVGFSFNLRAPPEIR